MPSVIYDSKRNARGLSLPLSLSLSLSPQDFQNSFLVGPSFTTSYMKFQISCEPPNLGDDNKSPISFTKSWNKIRDFSELKRKDLRTVLGNIEILELKFLPIISKIPRNVGNFP